MYASGSAFVMRNCKVTRSGYTNAYAMRLSASWGKVYESEFVCTNGYAIQLAAQDIRVAFCWIHDSSYGATYSGGGNGHVIEHCIVSNCSSQGVNLYYGGCAHNNTVYNCGFGITFGSQLYCSAVNNIVQDCTTGIFGAGHCYNDNNIVYNNTTQYDGGIVAGPNSSTSDPLLADPSNDDFTLDPGSPAFDAGAKLGVAVGLP
jgi:hypothetical protein